MMESECIGGANCLHELLMLFDLLFYDLGLDSLLEYRIEMCKIEALGMTNLLANYY